MRREECHLTERMGRKGSRPTRCTKQVCSKNFYFISHGLRVSGAVIVSGVTFSAQSSPFSGGKLEGSFRGCIPAGGPFPSACGSSYTTCVCPFDGIDDIRRSLRVEVTKLFVRKICLSLGSCLRQYVCLNLCPSCKGRQSCSTYTEDLIADLNEHVRHRYWKSPALTKSFTVRSTL